jgi:hypothetical protein
MCLIWLLSLAPVICQSTATFSTGNQVWQCGCVSVARIREAECVYVDFVGVEREGDGRSGCVHECAALQACAVKAQRQRLVAELERLYEAGADEVHTFKSSHVTVQSQNCVSRRVSWSPCCGHPQ